MTVTKPVEYMPRPVLGLVQDSCRMIEHWDFRLATVTLAVVASAWQMLSMYATSAFSTVSWSKVPTLPGVTKTTW